jgi:DNA helicase HerA-like ATPase
MEYDSADLTTHAVVTGMTGSGKTGLCIALLEEAALNGIPAIIIDPKGDLTNLLLHFPDLPRDFQPWIDPEVCPPREQDPEQAAQEAAKPGATDSRNGVSPRTHPRPQRRRGLCRLHPRLRFRIPVSVLSSLEAPDLDWEEQPRNPA